MRHDKLKFVLIPIGYFVNLNLNLRNNQTVFFQQNIIQQAI